MFFLDDAIDVDSSIIVIVIIISNNTTDLIKELIPNPKDNVLENHKGDQGEYNLGTKLEESPLYRESSKVGRQNITTAVLLGFSFVVVIALVAVVAVAVVAVIILMLMLMLMLVLVLAVTRGYSSAFMGSTSDC